LLSDAPPPLTGSSFAPVHDAAVQPEPDSGQQDIHRFPRVWEIVRHALPNVIEGSVMPLVVFLVALQLFSAFTAVLVAIGWSAFAMTRRIIRGRRMPAILVVTASLLVARLIMTLATGSVFVSMLQPTLDPVLIAAAFLVSVPLGRPLAARVVGDFVPLGAATMANHHVRRFFSRVSILWAAVMLAIALIAFWLLLSQSLSTYVIVRAVESWALTLLALTASIIWFRRRVLPRVVLVRAT